jgi:hypothetical protein
MSDILDVIENAGVIRTEGGKQWPSSLGSAAILKKSLGSGKALRRIYISDSACSTLRIRSHGRNNVDNSSGIRRNTDVLLAVGSRMTR